MEDYKVTKELGRGSYGVALLAIQKENGQYCVVKQVPLSCLSEKEQASCQLECELLAKLNHPSIVKYITSFNLRGTLHIVMQYCSGGDLNMVIKRAAKTGKMISEEEILHYAAQILLGLEYLHSRKILHRDIKASNCFLTDNNDVLLGDFGIARVLNTASEAANTVVGTPFFMAPELCESKAYSYNSDMWSFGCLLFELCSKEHAFQSSNLLGLVFQIVRGAVPEIPEEYSPELRLLVKSLLQKDPSLRPSARDVLNLPIIVETLMKMKRERRHKSATRQSSRRRVLESKLDLEDGTVSVSRFAEEKESSSAARRYHDERPLSGRGRYDIDKALSKEEVFEEEEEESEGYSVDSFESEEDPATEGKLSIAEKRSAFRALRQAETEHFSQVRCGDELVEEDVEFDLPVEEEVKPRINPYGTSNVSGKEARLMDELSLRGYQQACDAVKPLLGRGFSPKELATNLLLRKEEALFEVIRKKVENDFEFRAGEKWPTKRAVSLLEKDLRGVEEVLYLSGVKECV